LLRGEDTAYQKSRQREQQTGDKAELMDNSLQIPISVHEVQKRAAKATEQNGNKPLRRFSPMRQEVATNIAYAWGAVRQRELFDAEDQANAVREREDDFQKAEVA
jgi:flagellar biosynthesis component FlhA